MTSDLSYRTIFRYWKSLAGTLLLMAAESPFMTALIARKPEPALNLASLGVVLAIGMLLEAPILRLLSTSIALVKDKSSFEKLRKFALFHCFAASFVSLLVALDPLYSVVADVILGLDPQLRNRVKTGLFFWSLIPFIVGYRRFYHGVLISSGRPQKVVQSTALRLVVLIICLLLSTFFEFDSLALVLVSLVLALLAEAIAARIFADREVKRLLSEQSAAEIPSTSYSDISRFFYPLVASTFVLLLVHPLESFFLTRGVFPLESLAVLPVVMGLLSLFTWSGYGIQDTTIALLDSEFLNERKLERFAIWLALALSALMFLVFITPLRMLWYRDISGLPVELLKFTDFSTLILILVPATTVWRAFIRAILIKRRATARVLTTEIVEVLLLALCLCFFVIFQPIPGIYAACIALLVSGIFSSLVLSWQRKAVSRNQ